LLDPTREGEAGGVEEIEDLRDGVGAVLWMKEGVSERGFVAEVGSLAEEAFERMAGWEEAEGGDEVANAFVGSADAEAVGEVLEHVNAGASVGSVKHEVHGSVGFEDGAEGAEPGVRVAEMMEDSSRDDLIEGGVQFVDAIDGELVDLEVGEVVFALEIFGVADAGCTEVDGGDVCGGPSEGVLCSLRGSAAGDEDGEGVAIRKGGPVEMKVGATALEVLPMGSVGVEVFDGRRVRITIVEVPDLVCHVSLPLPAALQ
jgi:hypothetical protein